MIEASVPGYANLTLKGSTIGVTSAGTGSPSSSKTSRYKNALKIKLTYLLTILLAALIFGGIRGSIICIPPYMGYIQPICGNGIQERE